MINYRIYINSRGEYSCLGIYNSGETITCLDYMILEKQVTNKILVIEQDNDSDFPVFLYLGNQEDYIEFKDYINLKKELPKRRRKK